VTIKRVIDGVEYDVTILPPGSAQGADESLADYILYPGSRLGMGRSHDPVAYLREQDFRERK
jgi:hypothetical protein